MSNWKDIPGYEGYYQVSRDGQVRSVDRVVPHSRYGTCKRRGQIKSQTVNSKGYLQVSLCKDGKQKHPRVHQLVAEAHIGPRPEGQEVRHGLNGKQDNSVSNLSYGTHSENELDKNRDKTSGRPVRRLPDGVEFDSLIEAAGASGCHASTICRVCKGQYKTAGGYGWEYI